MESTRSWLRVPWRKSGHENRDPIRVPFLCDHDGVPGDTNAHPVHCVIKPVLMAQWRVKVHLRAIDLDGGGAGAEASSTKSSEPTVKATDNKAPVETASRIHRVLVPLVTVIMAASAAVLGFVSSRKRS